jgi:Electron transfer DM13
VGQMQRTPVKLEKPVTVIQGGNFVAGEHPTQGSLRVLTYKNRQNEDRQYIELGRNFKTDEGPDLYLILHRSDAPPVSGIKEADYISVARLRKVNGLQRYVLPKNINLADYKSVAVWCKKFNATFGYATLPGVTAQNPTQNPTQNSATSSTPVFANVTETSTLPYGSFKAAEHPTKGMVKLVSENNKRFLMFDEAFKTDDGPDLYVILYRGQEVPKSGVKEGDYVSIAKLQKTSGTQRYALPDNIKLDDYNSVAIWCKQFNATFGYAPLTK